MTKTKTATAVQADLLGDKTEATPPTAKATPARAAKKVAAKPRAQSTAVARLVPQPPPTNLLAVIARAAGDPRLDAEKMRALLDMQKEIMAEEARVAFTEDFIALQAELPAINAKGKIEIRAKDSSGERTGKLLQSTPYATFNEINKVTRPILQKHGFALAFTTDNSADGKLLVRGVLKHVRGHQETSTMLLPFETTGSKNNVQAVGSSMSYGKRYATIALLNLISEATEDRDDNGAATAGRDAKVATETAVAIISADQFDKVMAAIKYCGVSNDEFCNKFKIGKVGDLPANRFDDAMTACQNYSSAKGAKNP